MACPSEFRKWDRHGKYMFLGCKRTALLDQEEGSLPPHPISSQPDALVNY